MKHNCRWVLKSAIEHPPTGLYCEKPVGYRIIEDDDGNKHRMYDAFCAAHMIAAAKQEREDD